MILDVLIRHKIGMVVCDESENERVHLPFKYANILEILNVDER